MRYTKLSWPSKKAPIFSPGRDDVERKEKGETHFENRF